jgi:hypothetical protein
MRNLRSNDIYWLAGLLEGEGCFFLQANKYPAIKLNMTDLDIIQRARNFMCPLSNIHTMDDKRYDSKLQYIIIFQGQKAVEWMMTIYPLMGNRRKEKIREILHIWKNHKYVDHVTRTERSIISRRNNKIINLIMTHRNVSREEAEKIYEGSLNPENQTIN